MSPDVLFQDSPADGGHASQLYNLTLWLHLLKCDKSINQACEALGSFEMIEEVINSVFGISSVLLRERLPLTANAT